MTRLQGILITTLLLIANLTGAQAQSPLPYFNFGKGLGITAPDSTFSINLRFRIQNRVAFSTESEPIFQLPTLQENSGYIVFKSKWAFNQEKHAR